MKLLALANKNPAVAAALVALAVVVGWVALRGVAGMAGDITRGAVNLVDDAVGGAAVGVGDVIGLPDTDADQCSVDIANDDTWAASVSCPAARFIRYSIE